MRRPPIESRQSKDYDCTETDCQAPRRTDVPNRGGFTSPMPQRFGTCDGGRDTQPAGPPPCRLRAVQRHCESNTKALVSGKPSAGTPAVGRAVAIDG